MHKSHKTKIIATLGPASTSLETITALMKAGMDAARINFSHGDYAEHLVKINNLKKVREELDLPIPLILDTKGPEIRTRSVKDNNVELVKGSTFVITTDDIQGDETKVSVTYKGIINDVSINSTILLDDGKIELKVKEKKDNNLICEVINSGELGNKKGVNIPDAHINLPALTEKDIEDIKFGIKNGFDYIAASFIRSARDVIEIRKILEENGGSHIKIISKIENRDGIKNINDILEATDGLMIARGDLGVEIPLEEVPIIQKKLIRKCKEKGKIVVTATQMLESMVNNPRPTRAEASDVANAIFDGTDAIMLSGESAKGAYPVEAVETMVKIAQKVEASINYKEEFANHSQRSFKNVTDAITHATCTTANNLNASAIVTVTNSGFTAKKVAKHRPNAPILALTLTDYVRRQLNIVWGCYPYMTSKVAVEVNELFDLASTAVLSKGFGVSGDAIVIVAGVPVGLAGTTNTLKAHIL